MAKVIIHEEVNALIPNVFQSDPKKAVLYGDLSSDERFVINPNNSVTNLPYAANQALLEADIRVRGSLTVTLEPVSATVLSTATQMVFNITTGGTGTITGWTVVSATIGGADRKANTSFDSLHTKVTMTIPANTSYSPKVGAVQISVSSSDGTFNSNTSQSTQNPASRLVFQNAASSQSSTATTTTQAFTNNNCTNVAIQSRSTGVNATISGSNVVITFPQNTGDTSVTRTVTISGRTADNVTTSTTHTITQSARVATSVTIAYTGGSINASGETTDKFTVSTTGVTVTGYSVDGGASIAASSATRPTVEFPSYQDPTYMKHYNVVVYGTDIYGMPASGTCQVTQNMDLGSFSLSADTTQVEYYMTTNTLSIYNVTDMTGTYGFVSGESVGIDTCSIQGTSVTVTFPQNSGSATEKKVVITGTTAAGRVVKRNATFTQTAGQSAYLAVSFSAPASGLPASDTTCGIVIQSQQMDTATIGWDQSRSVFITNCNVQNSTVSFNANTGYTSRELVLWITGTSLVGQDLEASATCIQNRVEVMPSLTIEYTGSTQSSASGSTSQFKITKAYVTEVTGYSVDNGASVAASSETSVTIQFPANTEETSVSYTVNVYGIDVYGNQISGQTSFEQAADTYVFTITPNPNTVGAFDTTAVFTVTTSSINNVGISAYDPDITGRTYSNNTLTTNFSTNSGTSGRSMEISLTGTTAAGRTITRSAEISQPGGGAANLNIVYNGGATRVSQVGLDTNDFTITANNVTVTGYSATDGASILSTGATSVTVRIPANQTDNEMSYKVIVSGTNQYDQTTVTAETTVYQSSDEYTLKLVPSATSVEFTSTGYTFDIVSSNVTGIAISSHVGTTSETISGNQLVLGYDMNDSASSRNITVSLSGTTAAGRPVSCSAVITQSGESGLELSIDYTGETLPAAGGSTDEFLVTAGENVYNIGFSVDVPGATVINVGGGVVLVYEGNQSSSPVTYTVTVTGMTPTRNVSDSCTVTQTGDTFTFQLQPVLNPIAADATSAGFNLTATSVNSIGYYAPESLNVTGITGLVQNSVTAIGISVNTGSSSKTIRLVLSGTTVGGRTVYATGTTVQSTAEIASITITYNGNRLPASSGSTNDFTVTSVNARVTGYTVSPSTASASTTGETYLTLDYPQNPSTSSAVSYYITPVGVHLQTGVQVVGNTCEVVQGADTDWSFSVSPDSGNIPWDAVATSFTAVHTNVSEIGYHSGTNISSYTKSGDIYSVVITENPGHAARSIEITLSGKTPGGNVVYASGTLTQGAKPYNPDIWWTKTSEGAKSTEVTSVNDVPAFVSGTYDGRNVAYTIYINYNSDVVANSITLDCSLLSVGSASINGKTVTLTAPVNQSLASRSLGSMTISGTSPDNVDVSATLSLTQVAGVSPYIHIEGVTTYTKNYGNSYDTDDVEYALTRSYVNDSTMDIHVTNPGNFEGASTAIDVPGGTLTLLVGENTSTGQTVSSLLVTGTTVYGTTTSASFAAIQNGTQPQQRKIWIKSGSDDIEFTNQSDVETEVLSFVVTIDSVTALEIKDTDIVMVPANSTETATGETTQYTGSTSYSISTSWDISGGADATTVIRWKENGSQREVSFTGNTASTQTFVVAADTELSDFEMLFDQRKTYRFTSPSSPIISITNRSSSSVQVSGIQVYCKYYGIQSTCNVINYNTGVTVPANGNVTVNGINPLDGYDIESVFVIWTIDNPNLTSSLSIAPDLSFFTTGSTGTVTVSHDYINVGQSAGQIVLTIYGEGDLLSKVRYDMSATADTFSANGEFLLSNLDLELGSGSLKYPLLTWPEPTVVGTGHTTLYPDSDGIMEYANRNATLTPKVITVGARFLSSDTNGNTYPAPTSVTVELDYLNGTPLSIPLSHGTHDWYAWTYSSPSIDLGTIQIGETKTIPTNVRLKVNF